MGGRGWMRPAGRRLRALAALLAIGRPVPAWVEEPPARMPPLQPRLIRFRDAPGYLGMDRNRFNAEVRPALTEIPIGTQASPSTVLSWTPGWSSISTATGVPLTERTVDMGRSRTPGLVKRGDVWHIDKCYEEDALRKHWHR